MVNSIKPLPLDADTQTLLKKIESYGDKGWESLSRNDAAWLSMWGVAIRPPTPGFGMVIIRIKSGRLVADQVHEIGQMANEFCQGRLDLSRRAQLLLRQVKLEDVPAIIRRLWAIGITSLQTLTDTVRGVNGCAMAGYCPHELFDASEVIDQVEEYIMLNNRCINMPRKLKLTITGCSGNCCPVHTQDIALIPAVKTINHQKTIGFNVLVGGKLGGEDIHMAQPLNVFIPKEETAGLVQCLIELHSDHSERRPQTKARIVYLLKRWGIERFRDELEKSVGKRLLSSGKLHRPAKTKCQTGWLAQKQKDKCTAELCVPVGRLTGDQMIEVAKFAKKYGNGDVRVTTDKRLLIPDIDQTAVEQFQAESLASQLPQQIHPLLKATQACTGGEYCPWSNIETRQNALDVTQQLIVQLPELDGLTIYWSGCDNSCGRHRLADIGLIGCDGYVAGKRVDAVDVFVGGCEEPDPTHGIKVLKAVPCQELGSVLFSLIKRGDVSEVNPRYHRHGHDDEIHQILQTIKK